jgi:hypothetical protein
LTFSLFEIKEFVEFVENSLLSCSPSSTLKTFFVFQEAQAMTRVESSPFMTNTSPRKSKLPPPRHPLENRNSAPDIVVTGATGNIQQFRHSSLTGVNPPSTNRRHQHLLEDRIHRAKARVQNGLYNLSTSQSSSASSIYSTNSLNKPQKLSTRFQTATKINYKLAALSSFASVKRSRTFNISDVHDVPMTIGSSRTLPKPNKTKLVELGSGASSTASSRKSSNTSSNSSQSCSGCSNCCNENVDKYEISQEALDEIAAFEAFLVKFHQKKIHNSGGNNKMLERQKKIQDN